MKCFKTKKMIIFLTLGLNNTISYQPQYSFTTSFFNLSIFGRKELLDTRLQPNPLQS